MNSVRKYVFKQRLANERICIVFNEANGFYADLLEESEIWEQENSHNSRRQCWIVKHPLSIMYKETRYDFEIGDNFPLDINE